MEFLKSLGVHHVITLEDAVSGGRQFHKRVKELTGGKGVDLAYDGVGGDEVRLSSFLISV